MSKKQYDMSIRCYFTGGGQLHTAQADYAIKRHSEVD